MSIMKFKSNINCGGCKRTISAFFQKESKIAKWDVDLANPDKTLTVEAEGLSENDIKQIAQKAGFSLQSL